MMQGAGVRVMFGALTGDTMLDALVGAAFAVISYSSLAAVLLTATLASSGVISLKVALCLVIGANLGSGLLALSGTLAQNAAARRLALGSLVFKLAGALLILPFAPLLARGLPVLISNPREAVVGFHLIYNTLRCCACLALIDPVARICTPAAAGPPGAERRTARAAPRRGSALHALAGAGERSARSAAHRRHRADHARQRRRADSSQQSGQGARDDPHGRRRRPSICRSQRLPRAHFPRAARRGGQPPLDGHHCAHYQPRACGRHHRAHCERHRREEDRPSAVVFRAGARRAGGSARAPRQQSATGAIGVSQQRSALRGALAGGEGAFPRPRARCTRMLTWTVWPGRPCAASRPAPCIST